MTQVADRYETLTTGFEAFRRQPSFGGGALGRAREAAFERFAALGFPTTRDEEWRFTNVAPIAAVAFEPAGDASVSAAEIAPLLYPDIPHHLVLVNGRLAPSLSSMALPDGVTVRWDTTD